VAKVTKGQKRPSANAISRWETDGGATKKLPRKLTDDPIALGVAIMREATDRATGDVGDKITRSPKKPKR